MFVRSPGCLCTIVGRYRGGDAYQDTVLPPAGWKNRAFGYKTKEAEQRYIRSSGNPNELSKVAILSGDPRLPEDGGDER